MKNFSDFLHTRSKINESVNLTDDEKKFLWSKIEYTKKKNAIESENKLYDLLNNNDNIDEDDFNLILRSLEYTFRKKLKGFDKPMKSEIFTKIQNKIPDSWIGVKYSSLSSKEKRDNKDSI